jgi:GNAT superfamily N-acetyltransferase
MPHSVSLPHGYEISDDQARLDLDAIHAFIATESYWAKGRPREITARAIANSLCVGLYAPDGTQVGFARVITDRTTSAHLSDVFVLKTHRGRGLAKSLVAALLAHPDLATVKRWSLSTADAHSLYARFGFGPHARPENQMWRMLPSD